jgi:hypothetical protein
LPFSAQKSSFRENSVVRHFRKPARKLLDLPRYSPPPPARIRDLDPRPESPLEEAECQDQVFNYLI